MSALLEQTRLWVTNNYANAYHLIRTEHWLRRLEADASEALILAALTHDMERAFPGEDQPKANFSAGAIDLHYNLAHAERSARIVANFLRKQEASETLINQVTSLIKAHETGGWPAANLLQAADSLSFLEVNVESFLRFISLPHTLWTADLVRAKFDWMYRRIQIPEASKLAAPFYETAIKKLQTLVSESDRQRL
jgi:hypothetical protein